VVKWLECYVKRKIMKYKYLDKRTIEEALRYNGFTPLVADRTGVKHPDAVHSNTYRRDGDGMMVTVDMGLSRDASQVGFAVNHPTPPCIAVLHISNRRSQSSNFPMSKGSELAPDISINLNTYVGDALLALLSQFLGEFKNVPAAPARWDLYSDSANQLLMQHVVLQTIEAGIHANDDELNAHIQASLPDPKNDTFAPKQVVGKCGTFKVLCANGDVLNARFVDGN